ncbi:MAG: hypothetical protein ACXVXG_11910 [Nocardioidaceae bacterium]
MKIGRVGGSLLTVLAGGVVVAGVGLVLQQREAPAQASVVRASGGHVYVNLATYPDSLAGSHGTDGGTHPDWVTYGPSTDLRVPAHTLVTFTIRQYDAGEKITNPYFARVHGTSGGTATVNGRTITRTNPEAIGHTFTLHAAPAAQDPLFVSVPLPAVPDSAPIARGSAYPKPIVVRFSFMTKGPGKYVWNCEFPCGDGTYAKFGGPMSTRGYMSGTLTVT